jgi:hypothetical protein
MPPHLPILARKLGNSGDQISLSHQAPPTYTVGIHAPGSTAITTRPTI